MEAPEPNVACREVILSWSRLPELAKFAQCRRGYGTAMAASVSSIQTILMNFKDK